jgi:hypothetical protein
MANKLDLEHDYEAPPYEDSTTPPPAFSDRKEPDRPALHAQLSETRTRRIQNVLATHIEPLLYSHFLDGIDRRGFIIIPADILTQQPHLAAQDIVNLPNAGNFTLLRLHGDENSAAFWQQASVLEELESSIRACLASSGYKVEGTTAALLTKPQPPQPTPASDQTQHQASPSWWKRQFGTPGPLHDPTATTKYRLGWRGEEEDLPRRRLAQDEVRVSVRVREVSFRVETEMGLLDSVTGKALWLELEVGT